MLKRICLVLIAMVSLTVFYGCSGGGGETLTIFAAAGAKPGMDEVCRRFEEKYDISVAVTYGGGGEVLSQMTLSRSGDIYVAPEQRFMDMAVAQEAVAPETITTVAYMVPVIAVAKGNPLDIASLEDLARPGVRVAITRPETTLLGKFAPEIFEKAGLSESIGENIVTTALDPNNLLTMLTVGSIDAGITWHFYGTSASDKIEIIWLSPEQLTGIGEMQAAVTTYSQNAETAQMFLDFLTLAEGKAVFAELGYIVEAGEARCYWQPGD